MQYLHKKTFLNYFTTSHHPPTPAINEDCSEFEVNNWQISDFIIDKIIPIVGTRPYPLNELSLMVATICRLKPAYIFEWGTHIGKSARIFYETCDYFDINTTIHSIDLPDDIKHIEHPKNQRGRLVRGLDKVILYQGDGLSTSLKICKTYSIERNTLFFLDGDHEYKSVKRELKMITEYLPKANIMIHDTFYQSLKSGYNIGPFRAINSVLQSSPSRYKVISTTTGLPGMTLLYK